jgi:CheY-like chemotaxis protein
MADSNRPTNGHPRLVLLIDADPDTRRVVAPLLAPGGLEVVQAREGAAALEILQRLPDRFRLVILSLETPGISGAVLLTTLRLLRPELPVVCLSAAELVPAEGSPCVGKPLKPELLGERIALALEGGRRPALDLELVSREAVDRARRSFGQSGSLLDAAREIARGTRGGAAGN